MPCVCFAGSFGDGIIGGVVDRYSCRCVSHTALAVGACNRISGSGSWADINAGIAASIAPAVTDSLGSRKGGAFAAAKDCITADTDSVRTTVWLRVNTSTTVYRSCITQTADRSSIILINPLKIQHWIVISGRHYTTPRMASVHLGRRPKFYPIAVNTSCVNSRKSRLVVCRAVGQPATITATTTIAAPTCGRGQCSRDGTISSIAAVLFLAVHIVSKLRPLRIGRHMPTLGTNAPAVAIEGDRHCQSGIFPPRMPIGLTIISVECIHHRIPII